MQSGEHHVEVFKALSQPCWKQLLKQAKEDYCPLNLNEFPSVSHRTVSGYKFVFLEGDGPGAFTVLSFGNKEKTTYQLQRIPKFIAIPTLSV